MSEIDFTNKALGSQPRPWAEGSSFGIFESAGQVCMFPVTRSGTPLTAGETTALRMRRNTADTDRLLRSRLTAGLRN